MTNSKLTTAKKTKVAVIGMGYDGFPLACAMAKSGKYEVYGLDISQEKIDKVNKKIAPIEDKQAEKDIKKVAIYGTTNFSLLGKMEFIAICVPTPIDHRKRPDLTPVVKATESIAKYLKKGQTIILESTVNPGICEEIMLPILESSGLKPGIDFELAHCPERINPGDKVWNVYNIPRNVGALSKEGCKKVADFYRSFINSEVKELSSIKVAEATKVVENTFRDVNIAYVNELAQIFDRMGIDTLEVLKGASNKPFAFMPHYPGCGVGGHCIPVDPYYLIAKAKELGAPVQVMSSARRVNNLMPKYAVSRLIDGLNAAGISIKGATIGILGLSYKANISDMRESPSLEIKHELLKLGAKVLCCDPHCNGHADAKIDEILEKCTGIILATNHTKFLEINDWKNVKVLIDGRNCLDIKNIPREA